MRKIVVAITGASGSIYANLLIEKLLAIRPQWETVSIVMTKMHVRFGKQNWKMMLTDIFH